jgi:hypothetical protein
MTDVERVLGAENLTFYAENLTYSCACARGGGEMQLPVSVQKAFCKVADDDSIRGIQLSECFVYIVKVQ